MTKHYDILIIGGGMVGATLACALGESRFRIGLIESHAPREFTPGEEIDLRVSAISRASGRVFESVGAWRGMVTRRASPFRDMHVWDAAGEGLIHFDSAELGADCLGHIIENRIVQLALWERLQDCPAVETLCPAEVRDFAHIDGGVRVTLNDGRVCETRLLVGADGARSRVREFARIPLRGWAYDHHAVVATVKTEKPHRETAWQRFLPTGPLAFLPLHDGRCSIVWSTSPVEARQLVDMPERTFCETLEKAFDSTLGRIEATSERAAFPLRMRYADHYVEEHIALIGDAAHTVHPLAGQGVNLGLLDAAALAEVLTQARAAGRDIASLSVLRRYERWRKGHNLAMAAAMDGFKRLFGAGHPAIRWVRNTGLTLTHRASPLKNLIMEHAMGLKGDLPPLARQ